MTPNRRGSLKGPRQRELATGLRQRGTDSLQAEAGSRLGYYSSPIAPVLLLNRSVSMPMF